MQETIEARRDARSGQCDANVQATWLPIAEAAREFARTRQAIEGLIKTGKVEVRYIGPKALKHVCKEQLANCYAQKKSKAKQDASKEPEKTQAIALSSLRHELGKVQLAYEAQQSRILELEEENQKLREKNARLQSEFEVTKAAGVFAPLVARVFERQRK